MAPYCLPYLQHLPSFLRDPSDTFRSCSKHFRSQPFTLLMMNTKFHVFHDPATVQHVFARSRLFVFEPVLASMMQNGMALPLQDQPMFQLPSHSGGKGRDSASFVAGNHNIWLRHLTGRSLDELMDVYAKRLHGAIESHLDLQTPGRQTVNLHELLRSIIFEASTSTFLGSRIRTLWPRMWEDWKIFNDATYIGVRTNAAYTLDPRAGRARERMLRAFEQWIEQHDHEITAESEDVWDETWGASLNWERERLARQFGFSLRGRACLHASFLYVMAVNAVALVTWLTWCATHTESNLKRFRHEASQYIRPSTTDKAHEMSLDSDALKSAEWVQGLWKEALRLGTAGAAARVVMEDSVLEGFSVRKGSVILMPNALMHYDEHLFPRPETVDPERWMRGDSSDADAVELQKQRLRSLRPFGGGTGLCSGRFVAEQETIGVVSILLLLFDFDGGSSWKEGFRFNPRSIGFMEPAKEHVVVLKRRSKAHSI